ncbi:hypothetical protein SAMN03080614_10861 [Anaerobranca gottschalkii DSM 13577]|uniref:Uncharacterized protein n=1 Tax=Anaerobranca gottschalkii DSM 13577 TaxID=1120990 RepID=A0A1I0CPN4_9FIRM|nr:hypothetical protein SAMN03080614_10861 [Anaerobranca gottschalkii DSM 13577]
MDLFDRFIWFFIVLIISNIVFEILDSKSKQFNKLKGCFKKKHIFRKYRFILFGFLGSVFVGYILNRSHLISTGIFAVTYSLSAYIFSESENVNNS